jgi:hypothetical protein
MKITKDVRDNQLLKFIDFANTLPNDQKKSVKKVLKDVKKTKETGEPLLKKFSKSPCQIAIESHFKRKKIVKEEIVYRPPPLNGPMLTPPTLTRGLSLDIPSHTYPVYMKKVTKPLSKKSKPYIPKKWKKENQHNKKKSYFSINFGSDAKFKKMIEEGKVPSDTESDEK